VVGIGVRLAGDENEQAFELGDGERDQAGVGGWVLVRGGGQDRLQGNGFRLCGGHGSDGESGHRQDEVADQGGVETDLGVVETEWSLPTSKSSSTGHRNTPPAPASSAAPSGRPEGQ
jgi:hypothetical protein